MPSILPIHGSLGKRDWMASPPVAAVLDALEAAGGAGCVRFVGGCVRNALIGQPINDIDLATPLTPGEVTSALRAANLRAVPTGVEHGTITAVSGGQPLEVTTLRRDVSTDGRRAVVAFTTDWSEDARRRDFTLNALYADRDGSILDPTGHGVADARAGRILFVGDPRQRLREDYLRALRFFRFHAWYGRGGADPRALAACAAVKDEVATLAAERISAELLKLLAAPDPRPAVRLMMEGGVLGAVLPQPLDVGRFERLVEIEAAVLFETEALLRLAALVPGAVEAGLAERLRLSNADRDRLAGALAGRLDPAMTPKAVRQAVYRLGGPVFRDRAKLAWAAGDGGDSGAWRGLMAVAETFDPPSFPLNGDDALAAGAARGPRIGRALRAVEAWWIAGDFQEGRPGLLARLHAEIEGAT